jgi:hypothetical protein
VAPIVTAGSGSGGGYGGNGPLATPPLSNAGDLWGAACGRIVEDARRGSLRRLELAASPRPTPDGRSRGIAHRGSRVEARPRRAA